MTRCNFCSLTWILLSFIPLMNLSEGIAYPGKLRDMSFEALSLLERFPLVRDSSIHHECIDPVRWGRPLRECGWHINRALSRGSVADGANKLWQSLRDQGCREFDIHVQIYGNAEQENLDRKDKAPAEKGPRPLRSVFLSYMHAAVVNFVFTFHYNLPVIRFVEHTKEISLIKISKSCETKTEIKLLTAVLIHFG